MHARGSFEVTLTNQPTTTDVLGRRSIEKKFSGDLDATSTGEMLAAGTAVPTSAGYVAIERVTGTLGGKKGSFVLVHTGIMTRATGGSLTVQVLPDSGTDELAGVTGSMSIEIKDGKHLYDLDYAL